MRYERRRGRWAAALVLLTALAGCQSQPVGDGNASTPAANSPPPGPTAASPAGSATVGCRSSRPVDPDAPPNGPDDLIIGPLVYQGAVLAFQGPDLPGPAPEPDADGVTRFKTGAALPPDTTVTVSIAGSARSYAGIATEDGPNAGFWQVTYVSCPQQKRSSRMWWVGGFTLLDRGSGCVPVDVQVRGEKKVRHAFVALNVAPCHQ